MTTNRPAHLATDLTNTDAHQRLDILLLTTGNKRAQPLLLGIAAAHLRRLGFTPRLRDLAVEPLSEAQGMDTLVADLVAIGVSAHDDLAQTLRLVRRLVPRLAGRGALCCFGPAVAPIADALLSAGAHACFCGAWEAGLLTAAQRLQVYSASATTPRMSYGRALALQEIEGMRTQRYTPMPCMSSQAPDLAPARDLMPPLSAYTPPSWATVDMPTPAWGQVFTARVPCIPCPRCPLAEYVPASLLPRHLVLGDIAALVALGASHISFADDDFLADYERSLRITATLATTYPGLSFDFRASVLAVLRLPHVLAELRAHGATGVGLVVDAAPGGSRMLSAPASSATFSLRSLEEVLALCSRHGLYVRPVARRQRAWTALSAAAIIEADRARGSAQPARAPLVGGVAPAPNDSLVPVQIALDCLAQRGQRRPHRKRGARRMKALSDNLAPQRRLRDWRDFQPEASREQEVCATGDMLYPCCCRPRAQ